MALHMIDGPGDDEIILLLLDCDMPGMSGLARHRHCVQPTGREWVRHRQ